MLVIQEFKVASEETKYRNRGGQGCFFALSSFALYDSHLTFKQWNFHITAIRLGLAGADPALPSVPSHLSRSENPWSEKTVPKGNVRTKIPPSQDPSSIARDPRKYSPVPETRPLFMCGSPVATFLSRDHITQILFPQ